MIAAATVLPTASVMPKSTGAPDDVADATFSSLMTVLQTAAVTPAPPVTPSVAAGPAGLIDATPEALMSGALAMGRPNAQTSFANAPGMAAVPADLPTPAANVVEPRRGDAAASDAGVTARGNERDEDEANAAAGQDSGKQAPTTSLAIILATATAAPVMSAQPAMSRAVERGEVSSASAAAPAPSPQPEPSVTIKLGDMRGAAPTTRVEPARQQSPTAKLDDGRRAPAAKPRVTQEIEEPSRAVPEVEPVLAAPLQAADEDKSADLDTATAATPATPDASTGQPSPINPSPTFGPDESADVAIARKAASETAPMPAMVDAPAALRSSRRPGGRAAAVERGPLPPPHVTTLRIGADAPTREGAAPVLSPSSATTPAAPVDAASLTAAPLAGETAAPASPPLPPPLPPGLPPALPTSHASLATALLAHRLDPALGGGDGQRDWAAAFEAGGSARVEARTSSLGAVAIDVARVNDGLAVTLGAATDETRALLADAQPRLAADTRAAGIVLAQSRVDDAPQREPRERPTQRSRHPTINRTTATSASSTADRYA